MNHTPSISVCMPVYNRQKYIVDCIDSILSQTFTDFEVIIVDDGSTDETCDIIESYSDPRIKLYRNRHNFIESSNLTLSLAQGKYIARMDSDDIMMPDRLKIQYAYMESHPGTDILGGSRIVIGESCKECIDNYDSDVTPAILYKQCCLSHPTVMMRTDSVRRANLQYEQNSIYSEDYLMWIRAMIAGLTIKNIQDVLVKYRVSKSQVSIAHYYTQSKGCRFAQNLLGRWMGRREEEMYESSKATYTVPTVKKVCVAVPFYNDGEAVVDTVSRIRKQVGDDVDIIVVNDQSNDGFPYFDRVAPFGVRYLYSKEHVGPCRCIDMAARHTSADILIYINPHYSLKCQVWLKYACDVLERHRKAFLAFRPLQYSGDGEFLFEELSGESHTLALTGGIRSEAVSLYRGAWAVVREHWNVFSELAGLTKPVNDTDCIIRAAYNTGSELLLSNTGFLRKVSESTPSYMITKEEVVYNYLLAANATLPTIEKCFEHSRWLAHDKFRYHIASVMINENTDAIASLRRRFNPRPDRQIYFDTDRQCRGIPNPEMLRTIAEAIEGIQPDNYGLYHGLAAGVMWTGIYNAFASDSPYRQLEDKLADRLFGAITITSDSMTADFHDGASGIGYALMILEAVTGKSHERMLSVIDRIIERRASTDCGYGFSTGTGGILAYLCRRTDKGFDKAFLETMDRECINLLNNSTEQLTDYYAMLYLTARKRQSPIRELDLYWMQTPDYIPGNSGFWKLSINDGVLGTSLKTMINYMQLKK